MTRAPDRLGGALDHLEYQPARRVLALVALMAGVFLGALNGAILATALPTIAGELDGSSQLAWLVTVYLLTQCASTPLWGKAGDLRGRKAMFLAAISVFLVGSLLAAFSWSMESLVAFRAVQGIGSGGLMVTAQAIIADIIPRRVRGRYLSIFGGLFAVTSVLGPVLGGAIVEITDWRWIFLLNLPVGLIAIVLVWLFVPRVTTERELRVDVAGALLLVVGVSALVIMTSLGGSLLPWGSPITVGLGALAALCVGALLFVESRAREPIVPLPLFRSRAFVAAILMAVASGIGMLGVGTFLPLYFQYVHSMSPVASGLIQLPQVATMLLGSYLCGRYVDREAPLRAGAFVGAILLLAGGVALALLSAATPLWLAVAALLLFGLGLGVVMQFSVLIAQLASPHRDLGAATAMSQFFRAMGMSLGTAALGGVFSIALNSAVAAHGAPIDLAPEEFLAASSGVRASVALAYGDATHLVFLAALIVGALAVAGGVMLPARLRPAARGTSSAMPNLDG